VLAGLGAPKAASSESGSLRLGLGDSEDSGKTSPAGGVSWAVSRRPCGCLVGWHCGPSLLREGHSGRCTEPEALPPWHALPVADLRLTRPADVAAGADRAMAPAWRGGRPGSPARWTGQLPAPPPRPPLWGPGAAGRPECRGQWPAPGRLPDSADSEWPVVQCQAKHFRAAIGRLADRGGFFNGGQIAAP
jgi:hypothetical protein